MHSSTVRPKSRALLGRDDPGTGARLLARRLHEARDHPCRKEQPWRSRLLGFSVPSWSPTGPRDDEEAENGGYSSVSGSGAASCSIVCRHSASLARALATSSSASCALC